MYILLNRSVRVASLTIFEQLSLSKPRTLLSRHSQLAGQEFWTRVIQTISIYTCRIVGSLVDSTDCLPPTS